MQSKSKHAPPSPESQPEMLDPTVRAVISLVVILHLFCVFVALTANSVSVSQLHSQLANRNRLGFYTQPLNLEPPYLHDPSANVNDIIPYFLTYAREQDVDHRIEVLPEGRDETDSRQWIALPRGGWPWSEQYKRQQRLAQRLAFLGSNPSNEDPSASLATSIARHFLLSRGIRPQQVRSRRHVLMEWRFVSDGFPEQRDPWNEELYFRTPYTAQVLIGDDNWISVIKKTSESESAGAAGDGES